MLLWKLSLQQEPIIMQSHSMNDAHQNDMCTTNLLCFKLLLCSVKRPILLHTAPQAVTLVIHERKWYLEKDSFLRMDTFQA